LKDNLGVHPKIGWNIDPFGHTSANAAMFHDLGFEALFFQELDGIKYVINGIKNPVISFGDQIHKILELKKIFLEE
jgi:hypothetical protein